ncbi:site-specific DNA-methyltransferase [Acinetobacter baumannii]|uniref:DNA-methyltransferase n=1 Tax=Acinetobacter baumannii TaxID=470 RepID=UPI0029577E31|nr:site-specific DNA-methyltransferase [Acinetobacter baumannii]MDV7528798.1 site-specific DNA-methyltransferase [Acinetobacter baumannii]
MNSSHDPDLFFQEIPIIGDNFGDEVENYIKNGSTDPLFLLGNCLHVLKEIPDNSVDTIITSPPYWSQREYENGGIGLEKTLDDFFTNLLQITNELKRVLKPTGSFWLNLGDVYKNKHLLGMPWRFAFKLIDEQNWVLRNEVIWNKVKGGMDNSKDKLGNVHETIFHFVKDPANYFYSTDAIRSKPRQSKVVNGSIVSATGVSGVKYKRKIELSTELSEEEKNNAFKALEEMLKSIQDGKYSDFRMVIRGANRTTHSNSDKVSGRAKELLTKGFYFLKYHPDGSKPSDVWEILPESFSKNKEHFAPYPIDLCRIPILATCPNDGIVLDPFVGTGTTCIAAKLLNRKSIGIDISKSYLDTAIRRVINE